MAKSVRDNQIEGIDLSSLRAFVNCSEPMQAESHRLFIQRYTQYGLRADALATSYAMAENTFAVTHGGIGNPVTPDLISRARLTHNHHAHPINAAELSL